MTPTPPSTSFGPASDNIIAQTASLDLLRKQYLKSVGPEDRIHNGIHFVVLKLVEREMMAAGKAGLPINNRKFVTALAGGIAFAAFNAISQAVAASSKKGEDTTPHLVDGLGAYMDMQASIISRLIHEVTPPSGIIRS